MSGGGSVDEALTQPTELKAGLDAGLDTLGLYFSVTFRLYKKIVSPLDGMVYWCLASTLSPSALGNTSRFNTFMFNQPVRVVDPAHSLQAPGYLHHTTVNQQGDDESFSVQKFVFTSEVQVDSLSAVNDDELWVAWHNGYRFAFSSRSMYSQQAGLFHYAGDALYPSLNTQVVESPADLRLDDIVVSNSLPIWLTFTQFPLFPGFLAPDNISPPYGVVSIGENDTVAIQAAGYHDRAGSRWQLVKDTVKVTTYGVRNDLILDFLQTVGQYTLDNPEVMGLMNSPVPRDAKRGQTEFSILAQKKVLTFEVNYYQLRVNQVARQLILSAFIEDFIAEAYSEQIQIFGAA